MVSINLEEQHSILLDILKITDQYCRENSLRYSLAYGTLIGAIRHKGFIPWDDDIDIIMPRPDYDYFVSHFNGYSKNLNCFNILSDGRQTIIKSYHKIQDIRTLMSEKGQRNMVYGINIDVFPIDGLPDDEEKTKKIMLKENRLEGLLYCATRTWDYIGRQMGLKNKVKFVFAKILGRKYLYDKLFGVLRAYDFNTASYAGVMANGIRQRFCKRIFLDYTNVEFEGHKFLAIRDFDLYLSQLYSNYMEIPPLESRVSHGSHAYWK